MRVCENFFFLHYKPKMSPPYTTHWTRMDYFFKGRENFFHLLGDFVNPLSISEKSVGIEPPW